MDLVFFDIETDGLLPTVGKVHVLSAAVGEGKVQRFVGHDDTLAFLATLDPAKHKLVGHNVIGFDLPALAKVLGWRWRGEVVDTLRLSCLYAPDIQGGHSLDAWGERVGVPKTDYKAECKRLGIEDPWAEYNPTMGAYCDQDVTVTRRVYERLMRMRAESEAQGINWELSERIEHEFARWFTIQGIRGVHIDLQHTLSLQRLIETEMAEISVRVEPMLPPKPLNKGETADVTPPKRQFKADGKPSAMSLKWFDQVQERTESGDEEAGWYGLKFGKWVKLPHHEPMLDHSPMTLSDQLHIKNWLMDMGWRPTIWSYKKGPDKNGKLRILRDGDGKPIKSAPKFHDKGVLCEGLEDVKSDFPAVQDVVKWIVLRHRLGLVNSILEARRADGRVTADGMPHGTPTGRVAHMVVCNIPKADKKVVLGKECRAMFAAAKGRKFVGVDASGLELRMLAHYIGSESVIKMVTEGNSEEGTDIHTVNANLAGVDRNTAKTVIYGLLYGAGDEKLGQSAGFGEGQAAKEGKRIRAALAAGLDGFDRLLEQCKRAGKAGYIRAIDGRKIDVRSEHAVLNTLLQSAGSICVKEATNYMNREIVRRGLRAWQVIHMHDEVQLECHPADAQAAGELFVEGLRHAAKLFNLRCPLDGNVIIGSNWAETH